MSDKPVRTPGPDHPITVERAEGRVTATVGEVTIADTTAALVLREAGYQPVHYFPRADVDTERLERTDHATYCPYKGDAGYFSVRLGDQVLDNVVWTYEQPYDAVAEIRDHVAFYPDRVTVAG